MLDGEDMENKEHLSFGAEGDTFLQKNVVYTCFNLRLSSVSCRLYINI